MIATRTIAQVALGSILLAEGLSALDRFGERRRMFDAAAERARALNRPLIVVGDPDAGLHTRIERAYGCGDVCVDLTGCPLCPVARAHDLTRGPTPGVADNSAVVYVACTLEYVQDFAAAWREIQRMAGTTDNVFVVTVAPWTLTAALYPGATNKLRELPSPGHRPDYAVSPVTLTYKAILLAGLVTLGYLSIPCGRDDHSEGPRQIGGGVLSYHTLPGGEVPPSRRA